MHELSLVMGIFDLLDEISEEQKLKKINSVTLEAGELCGIIPEYMAVSYTHLTLPTKA